MYACFFFPQPFIGEYYCQQDVLNSVTVLGNKYLIIGGISHPGYIVSKFLKDEGHNNLRVTEDISSLGFDSGTWIHRDKLKEIDLTPSILNYENTNLLKSQLEWLDGGTIIYIPSLLFNAIHQDSEFDTTYVTIILKTFINILEIVKTQKRCKLVLFTPQQRNSLMTPFAAAIRLFSFVVSAYRVIHGLDFAIVVFNTENCTKTKTFHCCSARHMNEVLSSVLNSRDSVECKEVHLNCFDDEVDDSLLTNGISKEPHDVITSTFFTRSSGFNKNNFQFMKGFYMTAIKHDVQVLIFHDELGYAFQERVKTVYEHTKFVKINNLNGRSKNDARFYILYNYLLNNPQIRSILLQDLRDGTFPGNPFKVMNAIGEVLYVGVDRSFYVSAYDHFWMKKRKYPECHPSELKRDAAQYHPFYNAGTVAGTRDVMLTFLTRLTQYFDKAPHGMNCNMATVCVVAHNHFFEHTYSGYPFQGYTESGIGIPPGLAVRHKLTRYD